MIPASTHPGERCDLADEVLPLWEDAEGQVDHPALDGRPWRKACAICTYRKVLKIDEQKPCHPYEIPEEAHFYCLHRDDGGAHRVCASYAAIQRGRRAVSADPGMVKP